jgi:hypothetical protein
MENEHYIAEHERHAYVVAYNKIIDKCKAALAQGETSSPRAAQEPVTWLKIIETIGGFGKFVEAEPNERGAEPVYLMPPAAPVQEPIAAPKIEWVDTDSGCVVRYLNGYSRFDAKQIGEMLDFAAMAANKFYATPPAAQPAPVQTDSFQFNINEDVQLLMDRDMGDN